MEWWLILLVIFSAFYMLLALGLPVVFCFWTMNVVGAIFIWGGEQGLHLLITSLYSSISSFAFLPIPMFVLLGEVIFQSGVAIHAIDVADRWLGRLPGRLALVSVGAGTLFGALSGSSLGPAAVLGSVLLPDMRRRGYKPIMSVGPCVCCGGLASIIPPSGFAVLLAALAEISMGKLLIAGLIPGLMLASLYSTYIIGSCWLWPTLAPPYVPVKTTLAENLKETAYWVLPLGIIIFAVTGVILMGIATPTESAALGALASFIVVGLFYKKLDWTVTKKSVSGTVVVTTMIMIILTGSAAFSQILAFTGATSKMVEVAVSFTLPPILVVIFMQLTVLLMGFFMESVSILMITVPIFFPVISALGFDPIWFALLLIINIETGLLTPPFGVLLFLMKGLVPPDISMGDIMKSVMPFVLCNVIGIALIIAFPMIGLWLPSFTKY